MVFLVGDFFGASLRKVDVAYVYWLLLAMAMAGAVSIESAPSPEIAEKGA